MRKLVILRGCSGSGKTTKAKELIDDFYIDCLMTDRACICSADNFFIDTTTGEYNFDAKKLGQAHAWCKGNVFAAMSMGAELVILDNTNTQKWEYKDYLDYAKKFGYEVEECVVELDDDSLLKYAERNQHGVPLEAIERMAKRFEK